MLGKFRVPLTCRVKANIPNIIANRSSGKLRTPYSTRRRISSNRTRCSVGRAQDICTKDEKAIRIKASVGANQR